MSVAQDVIQTSAEAAYREMLPAKREMPKPCCKGPTTSRNRKTGESHPRAEMTHFLGLRSDGVFQLEKAVFVGRHGDIPWHAFWLFRRMI